MIQANDIEALRTAAEDYSETEQLKKNLLGLRKTRRVAASEKSEERLIAACSGQSRSDTHSLTPRDVAGNKTLR